MSAQKLMHSLVSDCMSATLRRGIKPIALGLQFNDWLLL